MALPAPCFILVGPDVGAQQVVAAFVASDLEVSVGQHDGRVQRGAGADSAAHAEGDVLLGHFVSRCVGIQHYRNNGVRYNKEPLHLRRDPNNPYDKNAISVRTLAGWLGLGLGLGLGIGLGFALTLTLALSLALTLSLTPTLTLTFTLTLTLTLT